MKKLKLKMNISLGEHLKGTEILVPCNSNGVPTEKYWRRRLQESKNNNCVEIVQEKKAVASSNKFKAKSKKEVN